MNQVNLVGRLTKDAELKYVGERPQTTFFLAINRNYRNNQGEVEADFVLCVAWGRLAERIVKYCGKGSLIGLEGKVHCRSYTNRENKKVYTTEIVANDIRFYTLKEPANATVSSSIDSTKQSVPPSNAFVMPETDQSLAIQL